MSEMVMEQELVDTLTPTSERKEKANFINDEITLSATCYLPKFGEDVSETNRGNLTIECIVEAMRKGYGFSLMVIHEGKNFQDALIERLEKEGFAKRVETQKLEDENHVIERSPDHMGKLVLIEGKTPPGQKGEDQKRAVKEAVERMPWTEIVSIQEAEKADVVKHVERFIEPFSEEGVGVVVMRRESMSSLPEMQKMGETIQNNLIHQMVESSGLVDPKILSRKPMDILNGTRFILNRPIMTKYGEVNPVQAFLNFDCKYPSGLKIEEQVYGVEKYESIYFLLPLVQILGIKVREVEVPYVHDKEQTRIEEQVQPEKFDTIRVNQATSIVSQNFDLIATLIEMKKSGTNRWNFQKSLMAEAIRHKRIYSLVLKHFDRSSRLYEITPDGVVDRGERKA